jgi:hypothetical protein
MLDIALTQKISSENLSNSKRSASFDKSIFETTSATSVTPKKGPLRLIVLYTCISLRGMIFMGVPSYFGTKTAAGTMIGKYFMGQT